MMKSYPGNERQTYKLHQYPGFKDVNIGGIYRGYENMWYDGINIQYPGYKDTNIRGTRIQISGVHLYQYPGYEGVSIRGYIAGVRGDK